MVKNFAKNFLLTTLIIFGALVGMALLQSDAAAKIALLAHMPLVFYIVFAIIWLGSSVGLTVIDGGRHGDD